MKTTFTFKHLKTSNYIENYASERLQRLDKFAFKPLHARFIFGVNRYEFSSEIVVTGENGRHVALGHGENIFLAIENAAEKLERQLLKRKEKVQRHKKKGHRQKLAALYDPDQIKRAA